ncbi:MAG: hypothetical protein MUF83_01365 [Acidimicrobiales bacterium]|nr:hypothetical protein [Acidimicrobiales bacterium]
MLSAGDEYPIHQVAEPIRHAGTSDRNFYDRYYWNLHPCSGEYFVVMGMGVYPNLGVHDAFLLLRRGTTHQVVRASRELGDRMDVSVGPFRVEVIEPLRRVRFVLDDNEWGLSADLSWEGAIPAFEEPRHYVRQHGRVYFDTMRFAQTGRWTGTLRVGDEVLDVNPDRCWGTRDRSWGIRPVGESEPMGIRQDPLFFNMWNYAPMQFEDFSILYIVQERADGSRTMEEAVRIWADPDRPVEWLGRPEHEHTFRPGRREVDSAVLRFPAAPGGGFDVRVTPLLDAHIGIGTGYGFDADWRHGAWQGPLVVQGVTLDTATDADRLFGIVDSVARFELGDQVGYGLHEYLFLGPHERYGLTSFLEVP